MRPRKKRSGSKGKALAGIAASHNRRARLGKAIAPARAAR
jgi:hypothetical protein